MKNSDEFSNVKINTVSPKSYEIRAKDTNISLIQMDKSFEYNQIIATWFCCPIPTGVCCPSNAVDYNIELRKVASGSCHSFCHMNANSYH